MPHAPITDAAADDAAVTAGYDALLGVYTVFVEVPRAEVAYVRLVIESWEDYAVPRTIERFCADDRSRSVVVLLAVPDFIEPCVRRLARLCAEVDGRTVPCKPEWRESLRRDLLDESTADPSPTWSAG